MEPVDVLRPLALGEVALGPGERQVDLGVEGFLCRGHSRQFDARDQKACGHPLQAAAPHGHHVEGDAQAALAPDGGRARPRRPAAGGAASRRPPSRAGRRSARRVSPSPRRRRAGGRGGRRCPAHTRRPTRSSRGSGTRAAGTTTPHAVPLVDRDVSSTCAQVTRGRCTCLSRIANGTQEELAGSVRRTEPRALLPSDNTSPERNGGECSKARARERSSNGRV